MTLYIRCMVKWWMVLIFLMMQSLSFAQTSTLSASTQRWIHKTDSLLKLSTYQKDQVTKIWLNYESAMLALEKEKQDLAQNQSLSTEQWEMRDAEIGNLKKESKRIREEQLDALWDEKQRIIYQQQIVPSKSPVGHMGIKHDRANCNICVKP